MTLEMPQSRFSADLQVMTKGPVDVTIVFSSLSIPVLNLSMIRHELPDTILTKAEN